jgi:phytoene dehydrogenase-like protein
VHADGYDLAIVGAGPNGLTAAAYLARRGARVAVLERRFERGGTFATDDYSTPFQYNIAQLELPLGAELMPYRELDLASQGIRFVEPELPFAVRLERDGEELSIGRGGRGLGAEVERMLAAASDAVAPLLYSPPRAELDGELALAECSPRALAENVDDPRAATALRYACGLAGFLEPDIPLGVIGAYSVARRFSPSLVVGGTKNLANALFRVAVAAGARAFVSAEVTRIERGGHGFRLTTADARAIEARMVISTLDPISTFLDLCPELAPDELRAALGGWTLEGAAPFTAHFGIRGEPPAPAAGDRGDALVRIFGFGGPDEVERHFDAALRGERPASVAGHLTAVSVHDPLQASPGPHGPLHVLRVQTMAPYELPGEGWDRDRTRYRQACREAVVGWFDGLERANLLFEFCDTPLDIERRFATTRRGSLRQGALVAGQTLEDRPHPSCSSGRTPVQGLYLGGGGVHPGVPGTLAGGYNAAAVIAEDLAL